MNIPVGKIEVGTHRISASGNLGQIKLTIREIGTDYPVEMWVNAADVPGIIGKLSQGLRDIKDDSVPNLCMDDYVTRPCVECGSYAWHETTCGKGE